MNKYQVLIGLEIHVQLDTIAKLFSSGKNNSDAVVNANTTYFDVGLLGTLPKIVNSEAVVKALKVCKALNMEINPILTFDRKHYFYSDLAKGYQITQHFHPIGKNGYLEVLNRKIKIERLHLEEDSAKQIHNSDYTLIDYNRSGIPLIEIVTEPEFNNSKDAVEFLKELRDILLYLKVSDCKLEMGTLRVDVNVSLFDNECSYPKIEIKNLNSFVNIEKAIEAEINRQTTLLLSGNEIISYTVRYDEQSSKTVIMRDKEALVDYHYIRDPNIPAIRISESLLAKVENSKFNLKSDYRNYYLKEYNFDSEMIEVVLSDIKLNDLFYQILKDTNYPHLALNLICNNLLKFRNRFDIYQVNLDELRFLIEVRGSDKILSREVNTIIQRMFEESIYNYIDDYILEDNLELIENAVKSVLIENETMVDEYRKGKDKLFGFFVGQILLKLNGKSNPKIVEELLKKYLNK